MSEKNITVNIPLTDASSMVLQFYDNGRPMSITHYKDGKLHGLYIKFYKNGCPAYMCHYENNRLEGECREWFDSGAIKEYKKYRNGALHGLRCYYGGCVDTMTSLIYKEGELVERKIKYEG